MINYQEVNIDQLSIHSIGNKVREEQLILTETPIALHNPHLTGLLKKYFFDSFKHPEFFCFEPVGPVLENNVIYRTVTSVFEGKVDIHDASKLIAEHLYNQSTASNILAGDLMVAFVEDVVVEDEMVSAIGIYKSEQKQDFIKLLLENKQYSMSADKGINISKLDKACLIINSNKSDGYKVLVTDKKKLNGEAHYWLRDFLCVGHREDNYNNTTVYIQATKAFIDEKLKDEFDLGSELESSFLDNSKSYFESNENFNEGEYLNKVFSDEKVIDAFDEYKQDRQLNLMNSFDISTPAVKRNAHVFKSVIKLDKNFHIYVHGNRELIERGTDEDGRKFYKLYYNEEVS
jgi:hypothetical protein